MLERWWTAVPAGLIGGLLLGRAWVLLSSFMLFALTFDGADRPMSAAENAVVWGPTAVAFVTLVLVALNRPRLRAATFAAAVGLFLVLPWMVTAYGWDGCNGC